MTQVDETTRKREPQTLRRCEPPRPATLRSRAPLDHERASPTILRRRSNRVSNRIQERGYGFGIMYSTSTRNVNGLQRRPPEVTDRGDLEAGKGGGAERLVEDPFEFILAPHG